MIIAIHKQIIARNPRFSVSHDSQKTWILHVNNVSETDAGYYMCQINSQPMISQKGFLSVVVPPVIVDSLSSNSTVGVFEKTNVTLRCHATGFPPPRITWKREDSRPIHSDARGVDGQPSVVVSQSVGEMLFLQQVSRTNMGAYLCIASNGVPPSVSKRIILEVEFPPQMDVPNQLLAYPAGTTARLECYVEAHPAPVTYWHRNGTMMSNTSRIATKMDKNSYQIRMTLLISDLQESDFGLYSCIARNSFGETNGSIQLNILPRPTTESSHVKVAGQIDFEGAIIWGVPRNERPNLKVHLEAQKHEQGTNSALDKREEQSGPDRTEEPSRKSPGKDVYRSDFSGGSFGEVASSHGTRVAVLHECVHSASVALCCAWLIGIWIDFSFRLST